MKQLGLIVALVFSLSAHAGSMCEPDFIHCGDTEQNELSFGDCLTDDNRFVDAYQVEMAPGTVVRLMAFAELATDELQLSVRDFEGTMLAEAAGMGGASLVLTVPEGAEGLGIEVSAAKDAHAAYRLRMTCEQADGASCQPVMLACGDAIEGELTMFDCPTSDATEDRYAVALNAGETIDLHALAAFGLTVEIGRRDGDGTYQGVIRSGDNDSMLRFTAEEAGTYEVHVSSSSPVWRGPYQLEASCVQPPVSRRRGVRH